MRFTLSSLFIALVMSLILIVFLNVLLKQKKRYIFFRSDLLIVLALIIMIRLILPVELPFTVSVYIGTLMNPIQSFFGTEVGQGILVSDVVNCIFVIGAVISALVYFKRLRATNKFFRNVSKIAKKRKLSDYIEVEEKYDYPVWITAAISVPMVLGSKKIIFLPDKPFTDQELTFIFAHEMQHIRNHDIVIKQLMNLLTIFYWWFVPVYWLNKNIQLALEIRTDDKATKGFDQAQVLQYASSLIEIEKKTHAQEKEPFISSSCFLINESRKILSYRIHYLIRSEYKKRTNVLLLCVIALLPFLSNSIVLEPAHAYPHENDGTWSDVEVSENGYLIHGKDGEYRLVINGQEGIVSNPQDFIDMGLPVIEE